MKPYEHLTDRERKRAEDIQERRDIGALVSTYLDVQRCPGGRLVHSHYMCLHCGADASMDECKWAGIPERDYEQCGT